MLTKKHQALKKQNKDSLEVKVEEEIEDIFEDELVPLPGGESLIEQEKEEFFEEDFFLLQWIMKCMKMKKGWNYRWQSTADEEKFDEAEGLLKLATTACEAGRMEEAKAGLKSYFKLLHELGTESK